MLITKFWGVNVKATFLTWKTGYIKLYTSFSPVNDVCICPGTLLSSDRQTCCLSCGTCWCLSCWTANSAASQQTDVSLDHHFLFTVWNTFSLTRTQHLILLTFSYAEILQIQPLTENLVSDENLEDLQKIQSAFLLNMSVLSGELCFTPALIDYK